MHADLIKYFGIADLPVAEQEKFIEEIKVISDEIIMTTIIENLSEKDREEVFDRIQLSQPTDFSWLDFVKEKVPDLEKHIQETLTQELQHIKLGI
jgi:hypothetical protein